jgi:hypothetical protein
MLHRFPCAILCAAFAAAVFAECPVDDFDDGDAAGWIPCGDWSDRQHPEWDASSGSYCLGLAGPLLEPPPPPLTIAAEWTRAASDERYANGCVRAGFRSGTEAAGTWSTHFVLGLRADCKNGGYKAMLGPSLGRISIFRRLELMADSLTEEFAEDTAYRAEFCAVGAHLSLKVWPATAPEPTEAQLKAVNDQCEPFQCASEASPCVPRAWHACCGLVETSPNHHNRIPPSFSSILSPSSATTT